MRPFSFEDSQVPSTGNELSAEWNERCRDFLAIEIEHFWIVDRLRRNHISLHKQPFRSSPVGNGMPSDVSLTHILRARLVRAVRLEPTRRCHRGILDQRSKLPRPSSTYSIVSQRITRAATTALILLKEATFNQIGDVA